MGNDKQYGDIEDRIELAFYNTLEMLNNVQPN
jgi:hypothetical protein